MTTAHQQRLEETETLLLKTYAQLDQARTIIAAPESPPERKLMAKQSLALLDWRVMELKVLRKAFRS